MQGQKFKTWAHFLGLFLYMYSKLQLVKLRSSSSYCLYLSDIYISGSESLWCMQKERGMGKKIDIKKIENSTKCQVTFSKRRSSLIKKSHEISVMCDVDVLFLAFSPSGRLTKFCSRNRLLITHF